MWSKQVVSITGPDDLRKPTGGSDVEIVQLNPGKLQGSIRLFGVGTLGVSLGRFDSDIRVRGSLDQGDRVVLGTIFKTKGKVTQWWRDIRAGDVGVAPGKHEYDVIFGGGASYVGISVSIAELSDMLRNEDGLGDAEFWTTNRICHTERRLGDAIVHRLVTTIASLRQRSEAPSPQAIDFIQRSLLEPFVVGLTSTLSREGLLSYTGARLVSETEDYIDAAGSRPVHISELSSAMKVSRRTLNRAFIVTLGMGPVAYLRRRRLSSIQSVLRRSDPETIVIGDLAMEYGFPDKGRFASYYRAQFGETPTETVRGRRR